MNQYEDKSKSPVVMSGELCSICGFGSEGVIGIYAGRSAFVGLKETMTALEVAYAIDTLSRIASDLTVVLADAAGLCNGCGELEGRTPAVFFVKYFSLKKASEFPVFIQGISLLSAGTD